MLEITNFFELMGKAASLLGLIVYLIFAILVLRQVHAMTKVIASPLSWLLRLFSWVHLFLSLLLFFLALMIL